MIFSLPDSLWFVCPLWKFKKLNLFLLSLSIFNYARLYWVCYLSLLWASEHIFESCRLCWWFWSILCRPHIERYSHNPSKDCVKGWKEVLDAWVKAQRSKCSKHMMLFQITRCHWFAVWEYMLGVFIVFIVERPEPSKLILGRAGQRAEAAFKPTLESTADNQLFDIFGKSQVTSNKWQDDRW